MQLYVMLEAANQPGFAKRKRPYSLGGLLGNVDRA
jgi:hypothetical protein